MVIQTLACLRSISLIKNAVERELVGFSLMRVLRAAEWGRITSEALTSRVAYRGTVLSSLEAAGQPFDAPSVRCRHPVPEEKEA